MAYQDILKILETTKICNSVQNFTDVYLRLPGIPSNGHLQESDCIRVRICEGRFAVLIREVCENICVTYLELYACGLMFSCELFLCISL